MLFDIKTVAEALSCSYEFVRARTDSGKINFIKLGANKMIPRSELIKLLTKGV
jgi:excisionase family DNA binding protein